MSGPDMEWEAAALICEGRADGHPEASEAAREARKCASVIRSGYAQRRGIERAEEAGADHALLLAAMVRGAALLVGIHVVVFTGGGLQDRVDFPVTLDASGCPVLTEPLRAALREALK